LWILAKAEVALAIQTALAVAVKLNGGTMIVSVGSMPRPTLGSISVVVPELRTIACSTPKYAASPASRWSMNGPLAQYVPRPIDSVTYATSVGVWSISKRGSRLDIHVHNWTIAQRDIVNKGFSGKFSPGK